LTVAPISLGWDLQRPSAVKPDFDLSFQQRLKPNAAEIRAGMAEMGTVDVALREALLMRDP
jgi:hypothetical protein